MSGTIAGEVIDVRNNAPIFDATVIAQPGDHTTESGDDGSYSITLPGGPELRYELQATANGYQPFDADGIVVLDNVTTEIRIGLSPDLG